MELWLIIALIAAAIWGWGNGLYWKEKSKQLESNILEEVEKKFQAEIPNIRNQAIRQSRSVITGQIGEQWLPFMPNFPYNPAEARFMGSPIDMLIFDGIDQENAPVHLVFLEIKTAKSTLTLRQKRIREAIRHGRIRWEEMRIQAHPKHPNIRTN